MKVPRSKHFLPFSLHLSISERLKEMRLKEKKNGMFNFVSLHPGRNAFLPPHLRKMKLQVVKSRLSTMFFFLLVLMIFLNWISSTIKNEVIDMLITRILCSFTKSRTLTLLKQVELHYQSSNIWNVEKKRRREFKVKLRSSPNLRLET